MARKTNCAYITEKDDFPQNLSALMKEYGLSQQDLASALGIKRQTISLYTSGQSSPDIGRLKKIAEYFNVSSDWLLGLSEAKSRNEDIQQAMITTGLSEKAISILQAENKEFPGNLETLSKMIESSSFSDLLDSLRHYAMIGYAARTSIPQSILQYVRKDQMRAMALIEERQDSITDIEVRFLTLKSNLGLQEISALFLNEARDNISAIAKEISEPAK